MKDFMKMQARASNEADLHLFNELISQFVYNVSRKAFNFKPRSWKCPRLVQGDPSARGLGYVDISSISG